MKIAITGTFGAGKSSVSNILTRFGYPVVDCDKLAKSYYLKESPVFDSLVKLLSQYPDVVVNDSILLSNLTPLFFNYPDLKNNVESIIYHQLKIDLNNYFDSHAIAFIEVPLLFELGWESMFDTVLVVTCDSKIAMQRLAKFRNYNEKDYCNRMKYQLDAQEKIKRGDYVIENNGNIVHLEKEVKIWLTKLNLTI